MSRFAKSILPFLLASSVVTACPDRLFWIGDGYCDQDCNSAEYQYDGGDCCEDTCVDGTYPCGYNTFDYDDGYDCKKKSNDSSQYRLKKDYTNFSVDLFCDKEAQAGYTVGYSYSVSKSDCKVDTVRRYVKDESVPFECQQNFAASTLPSYSRSECNPDGRTKDPDCYDRGHIIARSHLATSKQSQTEGNYVTNIFPQSSGFNQGKGGWYVTDEIIDCHRTQPNVKRVDIFGGLLYNDDSNDFFTAGYGIPTPDIYYRVVVKYFDDGSTPDVIAWLMKNELDLDTEEKINQEYNQGGFLIKVETLRTVLEKEYNQIKDSIEVKALKRKVMNDLFTSNLPSDFTEVAFNRSNSWASINKKQCETRKKCSDVDREEL